MLSEHNPLVGLIRERHPEVAEKVGSAADFIRDALAISAAAAGVVESFRAGDPVNRPGLFRQRIEQLAAARDRAWARDLTPPPLEEDTP